MVRCSSSPRLNLRHQPFFVWLWLRTRYLPRFVIRNPSSSNSTPFPFIRLGFRACKDHDRQSYHSRPSSSRKTFSTPLPFTRLGSSLGAAPIVDLGMAGRERGLGGSWDRSYHGCGWRHEWQFIWFGWGRTVSATSLCFFLFFCLLPTHASVVKAASNPNHRLHHRIRDLRLYRSRVPLARPTNHYCS